MPSLYRFRLDLTTDKGRAAYQYLTEQEALGVHDRSMCPTFRGQELTEEQVEQLQAKAGPALMSFEEATE